MLSILMPSCKKKPEGQPVYCPCLNGTNLTYSSEIVDSNAFYPLILGKWYLKQQNYIQGNSITQSCYCDTQYTIYILPNKNLILDIPGYLHDTVSYSFLLDTGSLINTNTGTFNIPGNTTQAGQIAYSSNFLILNTQFSGNPSDIYPPNFYFTRN